MPIDAGDAVPEVDLFTMTDGKPGKISTSEIFGSGTVRTQTPSPFSPSRFFLGCSGSGSRTLMRLRLPGQTVFFAVPGAFTPG